MLEELKQMMVEVMPEINVEGVTLETKLVEDLGFDSLGIMMLAMAIENRYNIIFEGAVSFNTINDVISYIESKK